ncbi:MAG: hypothetical protein II315_00480 [Rikenellaceae bacterium]|jgi:hypothetical protein|nr:hypothetical protein [Rikenellaceae bacterium]
MKMKAKLIGFLILYLFVTAVCVMLIVEELTGNMCNWLWLVLYAAMGVLAVVRCVQLVKGLIAVWNE